MKNMLLVLGLIFIPSTAFALIGFGIQAGSDLSKLGPETYVDNSGEIPVVFNSYEMKNSPVGGGAYAFVDLFGFALEGDFDFAVQSENDKLTVKLKNNSHLPSNFINASWQGFYVTASQRI